MKKVQQSAIGEIAKEIAIGNTCYIHKSTQGITTIDNETEDAQIISTQEQARHQIEQKIDNYIKIETPSTEDQLEIMEYFLEEVADKSLRKQLSNAIKRKNPIRNFLQTIESDMELKQQWRFFSSKEYHRWVSNFIIDAYNY